MPMTKDDVIRCLGTIAVVLKENKEYLTQLDAAIGDADHGINMDRGFTAVMDKLPGVEDKDIGTILKTAGMALVSTVGGAGGPLYGTFFMRAGTAVPNKYELTNGDLVALFEAALDGVVQRGRANLRDKTMVDAITPAVDELRKAAAEGVDTVEALRRATIAAEEGMKGTIPMKALKGRASYLGERSIGHQDPGATSSYLIFKAFLDTVSTHT
ncbi:MAG: PEP-dependent dihydroxyacetone kinase, ADP-binding subunit DhaL [Firmicutes bacterium]|uniref:Phosphoenolpyruvate---glycerone phosphotransferase subunit DhaL n=2 Tax=Candidatus Hakubella thermalkaliphila TaxID=2754717 RepID=A0A6V8QCF8_9ACTN|nr:dihydroxyacetone kinase subunit DhaL [Candidatus Hakubella thermalkaliphila]MBT9176070.1 PEP-dependent dihydroxyacetone kinase, ADP-binding subunit DhaL [Bacillota bacterium]GFP26731.1 phosphoenolpyruvate---glycerone phosphotransferase subunit DhaL [Candidatus Hakubella thermalkaliphila]GFP40976.1 phosphoenolpyruvate---glycerone phosphotransferase subunit DhaL [Candidatus Hakubella thermalkaliphila]